LTKKSIDLNRDWNQWFKSHWFKSANPGYFEIRFESAVPIRFESHGPIRKVSNGPCLPIARRSQTTQTINGAQWYSIQTH